MTPSDVKTRWPEFAQVGGPSDSLITSCIVSAQAMVSQQVFGNDYIEALLWMVADILAHHPFGEFARLDPNKFGVTKTMYRQGFERLLHKNTIGLRNA